MLTAARTWPMNPGRLSVGDDPLVWVLIPKSALPEVLLPAVDHRSLVENWLGSGNGLWDAYKDIYLPMDATTRQSGPNSVRVEPASRVTSSNNTNDSGIPAASTFSEPTNFSSSVLANIGYAFFGQSIRSSLLSESLTPSTFSALSHHSQRHRSASRSGSVTPKQTYRSSSSSRVPGTFGHRSTRPDRPARKSSILTQPPSLMSDQTASNQRTGSEIHHADTFETQPEVARAKAAIRLAEQSLRVFDSIPSSSQEQSQSSVDQLEISNPSDPDAQATYTEDALALPDNSPSQGSTIRKRGRSANSEGSRSSVDADDNDRCPRCKRRKTEHEAQDQSSIPSDNTQDYSDKPLF